jgi:pimeloyl-ACP methyl ester carboxylesterase
MNGISLLRSFNGIAGRLAPALPARMARDLMLRPRARRAPPAASGDARRVSFRVGLSGLRWGERGPAVLMLHGWEGAPQQFRPLVDPLLAAGRQVIALDAPAHGGSPGAEATLMGFACALSEAAVEVRGLESVVGHSLGAAAVAIALSRGMEAQRAVLIAAPSSIENQLHGFAGALGLPAPAAERFLALIERANGVAARDLEIARLAAGLRVPALIVHDRQDRTVPFADAEAIARAWPGARLLATAGLGHARVLADPAVTAAIAEFLTRA